MGTYTSTLYFISWGVNEVQFLVPLLSFFSRFPCFPDFFHARQPPFKIVYDSAKTTATIAHVYGVGYCCFCLKISLLIAAMDSAHIRLRWDCLFYKTNKVVEESEPEQQYCLPRTLPMSTLSFYQYHESVCLYWRIRRV